eukprot:1171880-Prorocentrum_minimum.AAC.1
MGIDRGPQGYRVVQGQSPPGSTFARADIRNLTLRFRNSAPLRMSFWVGQPSNKGFGETMYVKSNSSPSPPALVAERRYGIASASGGGQTTVDLAPTDEDLLQTLLDDQKIVSDAIRHPEGVDPDDYQFSPALRERYNTLRRRQPVVVRFDPFWVAYGVAHDLLVI